MMISCLCTLNFDIQDVENFDIQDGEVVALFFIHIGVEC